MHSTTAIFANFTLFVYIIPSYFRMECSSITNMVKMNEWDHVLQWNLSKRDQIGKTYSSPMHGGDSDTYLNMSADFPNFPSINSGARYLGSPSCASEKSFPYK